MVAKKKWSQADVISLIGLLAGLVACVAGILAIPGMPRLFHWGPEDQQKASIAPVSKQATHEAPPPKPVQRVRDVSSGQVNFGCDETRSVETPPVYFGRNPRNVVAQPEWSGLDNVKGHNQSISNLEDPGDHHLRYVKAVGSITGLDSQYSLGVKNCPRGGHGELRLHVSWTEDEANSEENARNLQPVSVTIRALRDLNPVRTVLTIKSEDGMHVLHEVPTGNEGTAVVPLIPGRYLLSSTDTREILAFDVTQSPTTITIRVSNSATLAPMSQSTTIRVGQRGHFLNDEVGISLNAITTSGAPPEGRATFTLTANGITNRYEDRGVGFAVQMRPYSVYLDAIDARNRDEAGFRVSLFSTGGFNVDGGELHKLLAFGFGVTFTFVLLGIARRDRNPTPLAIVING